MFVYVGAHQATVTMALQIN
uniref:Uncharacterized protein n=1 Tax=Anguilla anguilla TaxID=7936 RepID=A0A0E9VM09_ANGAN